MNNFKKEVIYFNQNNYDNIINEMTQKIEFLQDFVDRYNAFNLLPLNGFELQELFTNPKELLIKKITRGEKLNIGGLKMNDEKLFELLEKPKGMIELVDDLIEFSKDRTKVSFYKVGNYSIENNKIILSEERLTAYKEANTTYLTSQNQKNAFAIIENIITSLNQLKTLTNINVENLSNFVLVENDGFKFNPAGIKNIK